MPQRSPKAGQWNQCPPDVALVGRFSGDTQICPAGVLPHIEMRAEDDEVAAQIFVYAGKRVRSQGVGVRQRKITFICATFSPRTVRSFSPAPQFGSHAAAA